MNTYYESEVRYRYFPYKGRFFFINSVVTIKYSYIKTHPFNGQPIWKYSRFYNRVIKPNGVTYAFSITDFDSRTWRNYCGYFIVPEAELEDAIEEVIRPIEAIVKKDEPLCDWEQPAVLLGWIVYILVLFFSFIFTQWYLLWIVASWFFFTMRKVLLHRD